jgi:hypothetical protein
MPHRNIGPRWEPGLEPSAPFGADPTSRTVQNVTADTCCGLKTLRWVPEKLFAESREAPQPNAAHFWRDWVGLATGHPRGRDR